MPRAKWRKFKESDYEPAFVYVMQNGGLCKIGVSENPIKRKQQLRNASGLDIILRSHRQFETRMSALEIEATLHRKFARYREQGEWFRITAGTVVEAMHAAVDPQIRRPPPIVL
jgi:hypothetical protein